jgi:hypothetical protein
MNNNIRCFRSPPLGGGGLGINRYATAAISRKKKGLTKKRNAGGCVMVFINTEHGQKNMDKKTKDNSYSSLPLWGTGGLYNAPPRRDGARPVSTCGGRGASPTRSTFREVPKPRPSPRSTFREVPKPRPSPRSTFREVPKPRPTAGYIFLTL